MANEERGARILLILMGGLWWPLVASLRNQRPLDLGQKIWVMAVTPFRQYAFYCILAPFANSQPWHTLDTLHEQTGGLGSK